MKGPARPERIRLLATRPRREPLSLRSEPRHDRGTWQLRDLADATQPESIQAGTRLRVAAQHGSGEWREEVGVGSPIHDAKPDVVATPRLRSVARCHSLLAGLRGRHGSHEPRPANPRQRRARQSLRQRIADPAHDERLRSPQPLQAVELHLNPAEAVRHRVRFGCHARAEPGQSIESLSERRAISRRIGIEEPSFGDEPVGRPERHPQPDPKLESRPARVEDRTARPRFAAQHDRLLRRWEGGPAVGQANEEMGPVKVEKSHRRRPE